MSESNYITFKDFREYCLNATDSFDTDFNSCLEEYAWKVTSSVEDAARFELGINDSNVVPIKDYTTKKVAKLQQELIRDRKRDMEG